MVVRLINRVGLEINNFKDKKNYYERSKDIGR